jgi:SAM-dependent methyltransferase
MLLSLKAHTPGNAMQDHAYTANPATDYLPRFAGHIRTVAGFMYPAFVRQRETFGIQWDERFEELLRLFVATSDAQMKAAVEGYVKFVLDGMRLQQRFGKTRQYAGKTYAQAAEEVYLNEDYMFSRYLPGLMLSHYLWPHHYRQRLFFEKTFLPRFAAGAVQEFCDIGVGTGFYSRLLLSSSLKAKGWAFDISKSALQYGKNHLGAYGVADRWITELRDIMQNPPLRRWPFLVSVEVLEHLEDPLAFLRGLRNMLTPDGCAFISAAVTAAEKDHIYLYNSSGEVRDQLEKAGFKVVDWQEDKAYAPKGDEPVPTNVAFIVTAA